MSLQVWLPLIDDLHNQGLSDISEIADSDVTSEFGGKIGKCITGFVGSFDVPIMTGRKKMSVTCWAKTSSSLSAFSWEESDGSSTLTRSIPIGNADWHHYAFSIDYVTGESKFYLDGVLVDSSTNEDTTHYITGNGFVIGESSSSISLNDFRLFDHILSIKEIKELSKGLAIHYPLNDVLYYYTELDDSDVYDASGYKQNGYSKFSPIVDYECPRYWISTEFDGVSNEYFTSDTFPNIFSSDFTISLWVKSKDDENRAILFSGSFLTLEKTAANKIRFLWNNGAVDNTGDATVTQAEGFVLITITKSGNTLKVYKNGVLDKSFTDAGYNITVPETATLYYLAGDEDIDNENWLNGSLSDFRLYATALSDNDIWDLYTLGQSVDDHGNVYAYEINEEVD